MVTSAHASSYLLTEYFEEVRCTLSDRPLKVIFQSLLLDFLPLKYCKLNYAFSCDDSIMTILTLITDITGQIAFGQFWGDK